MPDYYKYLSISNHYNKIFIQKFVNLYPELINAKYVIQEKVHGTNVKLDITTNEYRLGSRNNWLGESGFFGLQEYVRDNTELQKVIENIKEFVKYTKLERVTLFGEFFGKGIQKEIDYGEKDLRFFDIAFDYELQTPEMFNTFVDNLSAKTGSYIKEVPAIALVHGLDTALNYDINFDTVLNNKSNNLCEGVVIKPYKKIYHSPVGEVFYLKKKNERFKEKYEHITKEVDPQFAEGEEAIIKYSTIYKGYLTSNRLENVISHNGEVTTNNMSKIIREFISDAKRDFMYDYKEHLPEYVTKNLKRTLNAGSLPYQMLTKRGL